MNITHISSAPEYITNFISGNLVQLNKIYEEGLHSDPEGVLACKCSERENRIDVQFTKDEIISELITKERWTEYKNTNQGDKKIMFIIDLDLDSIFIITV